jgi:PAS domain S-box-containing protein
MRLIQSGLFQRFVLAMLVLALLPSVFMGWQLVRISKEGIQISVLELHTKLADKTAGSISNYIRTTDDKIRFTVLALKRPGLGWETREKLLRSLIESDSDIQEASVLTSRGGEIMKVYNPKLVQIEENQDHSQNPGYIEFAKTRSRTLWMNARRGEVPRLEVFYPLSDVSDIRVSIVLNRLHQEVANERIGGTGYAMLVGSGGVPLIYPAERLTESELGALIERPIVLSALVAQSVGSSEYEDEKGRAQVGAYAPVPEIEAAIVTQQLESEAYLSANRMRRTAVAVIGLVCIAAILIAFYMARRLTYPLLTLTEGAEKVAKGEFPDAVAIKTGDELQEFADTFNRMIAQLRKYAEMQVDRRILEQQKTEAIMFSIGDGILMTDNDGVIQLANRKTLEILQKADEDLEGKPLADAISDETDIGKTILDVVAHPEEKVVKEVDLSTDERRLFVRVSSRLLVSPEKKKVLGVVTAIHDVTLEKELDKMKEEFLHSITHDLRNPLGSIVGFLEFLRKGVVGVLNPQQKGMVESMLKSANRLMMMVNNILDVAKMDSHQLEVNLKDVSLSGLASHSIEILGSLAQRRGITMDLDAEEEYMVSCDGNQIERAITNLLGNAIKFAPDDGQVTVHVEDKGNVLEVCVEDDGPGIPPSHIDKIFGKFEQVPGQKRGGTGLGLTITKRFVEAHHGRIWVESVLGEGARFYFTIPKGLELNEDAEVVIGATQSEGAERVERDEA